MIPKSKLRAAAMDRGGPCRIRGLAELGMLWLSATAWAGGREIVNQPATGGTRYYSTAEAPADYRGPQPSLELALNNDRPSVAPMARAMVDRAVLRTQAPAPKPQDQEKPSQEEKGAAAVPRVASTAGRSLPATLSRDPVKPPQSPWRGVAPPSAEASDGIASRATSKSSTIERPARGIRTSGSGSRPPDGSAARSYCTVVGPMRNIRPSHRKAVENEGARARLLENGARPTDPGATVQDVNKTCDERSAQLYNAINQAVQAVANSY